MKNFIKYTIAASAVALLSACGGGGSGGTAQIAPITPVDYQLRTAYVNYVTSSGTNNFNLSGSYVTGGTTYPVSGSGTVTAGSLSATTFESQPAQVKAGTIKGTLTFNGVNTPLNTTEYGYVDSNYAPLGNSGDEYIVVTSSSQIPTTARINDTGIFYSAKRYATSAKTTQIGTRSVSYVIEQNSGSNAFLSIISTDKDLAGKTTTNNSAKFSMTPAGVLTRVNETGVQFTTSPPATLTLVINY